MSDLYQPRNGVVVQLDDDGNIVDVLDFDDLYDDRSAGDPELARNPEPRFPPGGNHMPKIRVTRRADGRCTVSGLEQEQVDALVSALANARIAYRDSSERLGSTGKTADAEMARRLDDVHATMSELGLALAPLASPVERDLAG